MVADLAFATTVPAMLPTATKHFERVEGQSFKCPVCHCQYKEITKKLVREKHFLMYHYYQYS